MKNKHSLVSKVHALKLTIVALLAFVIGVALLTIARNVATDPTLSWLGFWPIGEIGGILVGAGIFGTAVDFFTGRDKDAADSERMRAVLVDMTPEFRNAVVAGFVNTPEDMRAVATDETLDKLATNALSLRLGDEQFAREMYRDIRDQAIAASERWYDVVAKVRLSSVKDESAPGAALFDVFVEWEYTTTPAHAVRTFASVSDRDEARDLASLPATATWFMAPRQGLDARQQESFELLYFALDGKPQKVRRQQRRSGQSYVVRLEERVVGAGPARIRHIYRARTARSGHYLFIEMPQLARGLDLTIDYGDTEIVQMRVTDLLTGSRRSQVVRRHDITGEKSVSVDHAGWVLPRAGVAVAWTLFSEEPEVLDADDVAT